MFSLNQRYLDQVIFLAMFSFLSFPLSRIIYLLQWLEAANILDYPLYFVVILILT